MTNKLLKAWGAGFARNILLQILIIAIVLPLGCLCVLLPTSLAISNSSDNSSIILLAISLTLFITLIFGGTFSIAAWMVLSRKRQLDDAFTPLGLTGSLYLLNGRQYHGTVAGRRVDVYFYRGPMLDLYLSTPLKTRLSIGQKDSVGQAVAGLINRQPVNLNDPELSRLNVFPSDETWTRALLADPVAKGALLRLTSDEGPYELRQVHLQPEAFLLKLYHTDQKRITLENARQWLSDLTTLARIAESLPAPEKIIEASPLEKSTRVDRNKFILPIFGITCGIVAVLSLCAIIPAIALALIEGR